MKYYSDPQMIAIILFSELVLFITWYLIHILIVASSRPILTEQSLFHTRSFGIDTYFPQWVTQLLLQIVHINWTDCNEFSALHYACRWDDYNKVQLLLSYGADPDVGRFTSLDLNILRNNSDIIKLLTHNGIFNKPLYTQNTDILRLLLQHGCEPNYFLDDALDGHHLHVLMLLIDYGVDQSRLLAYDPIIDDYMISTIKCTE
jgi:ankyrin repeat protein